MKQLSAEEALFMNICSEILFSLLRNTYIKLLYQHKNIIKKVIENNYNFGLSST